MKEIFPMILIQVVLIALNAIFACAEIAVISMNETKLSRLAEDGDKRAVKLQKLTSQPARFLATIQVAITLSGFLGSAFAADNFAGMIVDALGDRVPVSEETLNTISVVVITLALSYFTLVFGELVPKRLAQKNSEKLALGMATFIGLISKVFAPIVWVLTASTNLILRMFGIDPDAEEEDVTEEEIRMMVDAGSDAGTIDEEGNDPSGLYWLPKKAQTANTLLSSLSDFSDWLYINYKTEQLNPWREATRYEERLKYMALINRSERSFLGHLDDIHDISETAKTVRNVVTHKNPYAVRNGTKAFPEDKIEKLLREGFKKTRKGYELDLIDGYNWRDIAITILMHYGGLRHSEPFHLWVQDVIPDPEDPDMAIVRIYHPSEGKAPHDFKNPSTGKYVTDRASYLKLRAEIIREFF